MPPGRFSGVEDQGADVDAVSPVAVWSALRSHGLSAGLATTAVLLATETAAPAACSHGLGAPGAVLVLVAPARSQGLGGGAAE
jgi:hypothetical protein